eukprot:11133580-Lingulodinium_polyedra.AAC.1
MAGRWSGEVRAMVVRQKSAPTYFFGVWKRLSLHRRSPAHAYDQGRRSIRTRTTTTNSPNTS